MRIENISEKKEEIEKVNVLIEEKQEEIDSFEIEESEKEEEFNDMLNDIYDSVFNILPSRIMSEIDPIMYRCELSNYVDSLEDSEEESYKELEAELEELENELATLEEELEEL